MAKIRLDQLLVERGLADSRNRAQRLVMAGQVRVNGQVVYKPSAMVTTADELAIDQGEKYVSRGGGKLEAALLAFNLIQLNGWICADVGASTGGFTDCLLQHGAAKIYAIDVGFGLLHWKLRNDPRVILMERTNARFVEKLPEPLNLAVIDSSFISLKVLLPVVVKWFPPDMGKIVALVKPQFEAGREQVARGEGVVRDPGIHRKVLQDITTFVLAQGWGVQGLIRSPLLGPKGNQEFLLYLDLSIPTNPDLSALIDHSLL